MKGSFMSSPNLNPEWIWGVAIIILGIALAYGVMRSGQRTRAEKNLTDQATLKNYREEDT
jgi:hypothetical protein